MTTDQREIRRKLRILQHAERIGSISKTQHGITFARRSRIMILARSRGSRSVQLSTPSIDPKAHSL